MGLSKYFFLIIAIVMLPVVSFAQIIKVEGRVLDEATNEPVDFVTIHQKATSEATESNEQGLFKIEMDLSISKELVFNRIGYETYTWVITKANVNRVKRANIRLKPSTLDLDVTIKDAKLEEASMVKESVEELIKLPSTTGNLESVLPHIALGATSGTGGELSSQYNVRGGNYDENLIYVNDFEIFRPQLIRAGQQEGLTFPNIDLIRDLSFSSGGFEARYGDKMSSVLDIRYKRPEKWGGSFSSSFLGGSAHIEGSKKIKNQKLRFLFGARYKSTQYLLGSLDVKGEYTPQFFDVQTYITHDFNEEWQLSFIGNYNYSQYNFTPVSRSTAFGLIDFTLQLSSAFQGAEKDNFIHGMSGVGITYLPKRKKNPLFLKLMASNYQGQEIESFDILGFYRLSQIETSLGSDEAGEEIAVLGTGIQHNYARNFLFSRITNVEHRGGIDFESELLPGQSHFLQWSLKWQHELIEDELNEWERIDSAGYSLPFNENEVLLNEHFFTKNTVQSNRLSAYVQDAFTSNQFLNSELKLTIGTRASYWDQTGELLISPRIQALIRPESDYDLSYKFATGIYYQPPFYREYRNIDGTLNLDNIRAQRSIHVVGGLSFNFDWPRVSEKKFKLITELYYKKLDRLISYDVDNVRIRYSGSNDASGYAVGMDIRVNGEFVPGAESWVNLSILNTQENITDVQHLHREVGDTVASNVQFVPRPTDRLFNISMFFQDYLPRYQRFKMQLNLNVGSGLPFGVKGDNLVFRNPFRFKIYHRVDSGFSYALWDDDMEKKFPNSIFRVAKSSWVSLEVFNLLNISNVASNTWIKTIYGRQYAVSNFLTSRRINLKWYVEF